MCLPQATHQDNLRTEPRNDHPLATTPLGSAESFGTLHFGGAQLGHVARTRRLVRSADPIVQHPGGTLPQKLHDPAALDAFYRLANRKEVTHAGRPRAPPPRTLDLMRQAEGPVLRSTTPPNSTTPR